MFDANLLHQLLESVPVNPAPNNDVSEEVPARAPSDPNDLTRGSIPRHLIRLALPGALTNMLSFSTTLVDMIWLGRISPVAIAAITSFNYFWFLFALLNMMVGNGSVALISRTYGAGDYDECRKVFGQTFTFKLLVAAIVMIIGLGCLRFGLTIFGVRDEVLQQALTYGTIIFCATPLMFSTFTLKTGFRAIGDMKRLLQISFCTALINFIFDPFLIFERVFIGPFPSMGIAEPLVVLPGFGLGIAGAAWGTVCAFAIVFIAALFMFTTGRTFIHMRFIQFFNLNVHTAWRILRIGVPPALGNAMEHVANIFVGAGINTYGTAIFAAQGVNQMLSRIVRMSVMGLNMAGITLVGQNLGARQAKRAELSALQSLAAALVFLLGVAALVFFFAPQIARLFVPGADPASIETAQWAVKILRINCFVYLAFGLSRVSRVAFLGSGDTKPTLLITALTTWGIQIPLTLLGVYLLRLPDPLFIWWVEAGAYLVAATILFIIMRRGKWQNVKV